MKPPFRGLFLWQKRGDYEYWPETYTLSALAKQLVEDGEYGDPETLGPLVRHIDYRGLGETLRQDAYAETSLGVVRVSYL